MSIEKVTLQMSDGMANWFFKCDPCLCDGCEVLCTEDEVEGIEVGNEFFHYCSPECLSFIIFGLSLDQE